MFHWKKQDPKALVVDIVAPGTTGEDLTISEAIEKFMAEYKGGSGRLRNYLFSSKHMLEAFKKDKKLNSLTAADMMSCVSKLKKDGHRDPTAAITIRSAFLGVIRWLRTGDAASPGLKRASRMSESNPNEEFEFRPQTLTLETITLLKNIRGLGRFAKPKLQLLQLIKTANGTPGFSLPPVGPLKEDEKERKAFIHSVSKLFKDRSIPWRLEWTPIENIFLLEKIAPASAPVEAAPVVAKKIKGGKKSARN